MRDKIISFLLAIITLGIMAVISVMGYMIYKEITGQSIIPEDFVGEIKYILGEETINQNTTIIQENSFDGVDGQKINKITKYKHLYDQLDSTAKTIYDKLYENRENLKTGTYTVEFGNAFQSVLSETDGDVKLKKDYQSAIEAFIYENPEIFYIDATSMFINIEKITKITGTKYNVYIDNGSKENYLAEGFNSKEDIDNWQKELEKIRNSVIATIEDKEDYEKIEIIHDYLVDTIEYDSTTSLDNIYNIYGALIGKKCVCEGYAKAFQYLMSGTGIDNTIVIGTGTNSKGKTENHAWNYVKLNGKWYAVDTTWDDPIIIGNGKLPLKSKYQYFLKGSNTMNQNHFISGKFTDAGQMFSYPELSVDDYE